MPIPDLCILECVITGAYDNAGIDVPVRHQTLMGSFSFHFDVYHLPNCLSHK